MRRSGFQYRVSLWGWLACALRALADCECGYSINDTTTSSTSALFTELWETDFLHLTSITTGIGWQPQDYNVSARDARGPYGKEAQVRNVVANPLKDANSWNGPSIRGGDPGMQLWARTSVDTSSTGGDDGKGRIPMAEVVSMRNDLMYGSFRAGIKYTGVNGTCGAWFWYRNDTQEIDIELLSRQFHPSRSQINLVLQSTASKDAGFNAAGTAGFATPLLPFDPSSSFHEYRYDWLPDRVEFYVDGQLLHVTRGQLYTNPGKLMLNHWSNGDPAWSGGPPNQDAVMTVMYIKSYFNATQPNGNYRQQCQTYDAKKVCQIPDQMGPPALQTDPSKPPTFFFSTQNGMTAGQDTGLANSSWSPTGQHNAGSSLSVRAGSFKGLGFMLFTSSIVMGGLAFL